MFVIDLVGAPDLQHQFQFLEFRNMQHDTRSTLCCSYCQILKNFDLIVQWLYAESLLSVLLGKAI